MTTGTGNRDRRSRAAGVWNAARVDSEFAAIVSRVTDPVAVPDRVPPAERLPDVPTGRLPAVARQAGRIASALFCTGRLDPAFVAFAVRRAAEHGRVDPDEVVDLVAARVLTIAAGLLAPTAEPARRPSRAPDPQGRGERRTAVGRVDRWGDGGPEAGSAAEAA